MPLDLNQADTQTVFGELIPDNTVAIIQMNIRAGNAGEDGWGTQSTSSNAVYLSAEFTIVDGPFAKRKFWSNLTVDGDTEGHQKAVKITLSRLRAIVESAKGIEPGDTSDAARKAREVEVSDFDGIRFLGKVGIEKGKDSYPDRNTLKAAITPDQKEYRRAEQIRKTSAIPFPGASAPGSSGPSASRPTAW